MYHITPYGKVQKCTATGACPYGGIPHFDTKLQANSYLHEHMAQYGGTPKKNDSGKGFFKALMGSAKDSIRDIVSNPPDPDVSTWAPQSYVAPAHNPPETGLPPGFTRHALREEDGE